MSQALKNATIPIMQLNIVVSFIRPSLPVVMLPVYNAGFQ